LELKADGDAIEGASGPLDIPGFFPLQWRGTRTAGGAHLLAMSKGKTVGALDLSLTAAGLRGSGKLFGSPFMISGARAKEAVRAPTTFDYDPSQGFR
jgi:hypothetical protein